ncbi:hypothetical protein, partial [Salmonella sp. s57936]|uniref:hypothetical protein n=1 Tax=Salmonella sp. s57936 TaxID=3159698 RepID=UPI00398132F9
GKWDVVVDLFFYRDPEEAEKDELAAKEAAAASAVQPINKEQLDYGVAAASDWNESGIQSSWADETSAVPPQPVYSSSAAPVSAAAAPIDEWTAPVATATAPHEDWNPSATG